LTNALFETSRRELSKGGALMIVARYAAIAMVAGWLLSSYAHLDRVLASVSGFIILAIACIFELAASRPIRDLIFGTSLASVVAFAVAGCAPGWAEPAAAVGYASAVFTAGLLVYRERYA
jgi:hypothetical protein